MKPTRITITADDVRGLFQRFPGWEKRRSGGSNWEDWEYLPTKNSACIPITPGVELMADYQSCLWGTVRDAGFAMGIGTDIYVHLGMMLASRPKIYLHGWLEKERRAGRPLPDPAWEPGEVR